MLPLSITLQTWAKQQLILNCYIIHIHPAPSPVTAVFVELPANCGKSLRPGVTMQRHLIECELPSCMWSLRIVVTLPRMHSHVHDVVEQN